MSRKKGGFPLTLMGVLLPTILILCSVFVPGFGQTFSYAAFLPGDLVNKAMWPKTSAMLGNCVCRFTYDQSGAHWSAIEPGSLIICSPPSINQSTKPNHDPQLTNRQVLKANSWRITHGPPAFYGLAWKISWEHGTNNDNVQKQRIFKEKNISQMSLFAACLTAHVKWLPHSHCRDSSHFSDKESVKGREEEQLDLET